MKLFKIFIIARMLISTRFIACHWFNARSLLELEERSLSKSPYTKTNKRSRTLASLRWSLPIFPNRGCFGLSILF
ncbi:hypothetical protein [uncultured Nostoc sp.]|uniref:hypothetical protein n=1 Tax=uncultured Nostoc sp. TaxID=340711 RepID=UPI0035CAD9A4